MPAILLVSILSYRTLEAAKESALAALQRDVAMMASQIEAAPASAGRLALAFASAAAWSVSNLTADSCRANLGGLLGSFPAYSTVGVYRGGQLVCADGAGQSIAQTPSITDLRLNAIEAGATRSGVFIASGGQPAIFAAGRANSDDVVVVLVIDPARLAELLRTFQSFDSSMAWLVNERGVSLTTNADQGRARMAALPILLSTGEQTWLGKDDEGRPMLGAARKIAGPDIWLITQQREAEVFAEARGQLILAVIAPILTLLLVGFAAWLGMTQFVIKWINRLILVTRAYSEGNLGVRVGDAHAAPVEIRELAKRFDNLADRMAERSLELEGEVMQKRRYIRELHHRVKNNLQVIASLLALQKRALPPAQRAILRFPEDRINAMAAAFAVSYAHTESGDVGALSVVREVITRLEAGVESGHPRAHVAVTGEDQMIDLDTAVALSMLLAGLLPFYFDQSVKGADIKIDATIVDGLLTVAASGIEARSQILQPLSDRFTRAYLRQLNGELEETEGGGFRLKAALAAETRPASGQI